MDVNLVSAEVLVIGPEDRLIIHVEDCGAFGDDIEGSLDAFRGELEEMGIGERTLILCGEEIKFVKVAPDELGPTMEGLPESDQIRPRT